MDVIEKAKQLLEAGTVQAVAGFRVGTPDVRNARSAHGARRPVFVRRAEDAGSLVFDADCRQNLAQYTTRTPVKRLGRLALTLRPAGIRALLQLMAERQIQETEVLALAVDAAGQVTELATAEAMEAHLALAAEPEPAIPAEDRELLDRLARMTRAERWAFWQKELSRCIKCYACRSSCPMCYCGQCTMDCNRPQWVPAPSHALGNLEYHMVRAMHLAGRCVQCGDCGRACPVGIPVHLLTFNAEATVHAQFGQRAGASSKLDYALSTFRPDDKETFIR
jgi:ferredoxin